LRLLVFASQSPSTQPQNVSYLLRYMPFFKNICENKNAMINYLFLLDKYLKI